jgi:hypothetical protein
VCTTIKETIISILNIVSAGALKKKLKAARLGLEESLTAFEGLDGSLPMEQHLAWLEQEQQAMEARKSNPKAMDIFEVQMDKGEFLTVLMELQ